MRGSTSNNITWSQRFEEAGANVIYGFHDFKVHSKICSITKQTPEGLQYITQLGTGNYNEKTAKLYTDFSFITTDPAIGRDANEFFRNMGLEATSRSYQTIWVAPLQIKQNILAGIDEQIELARDGKPCGCFFKTNSVTDKDVIEKIEEASRAGVPIKLLVRGISCLIPQVPGHTENVHVVSIVGRLLEHSHIYAFGPHDQMRIYLSSADLMTRNMDKRIEIAWPVQEEELRQQVLHYIDVCMRDTAKLRELLPDGTYTKLREFAVDAAGNPVDPFNAQEFLIAEAKQRSEAAHEAELSEKTAFEKLNMQATDKRRADAAARAAANDLEETYREALKHEVPAADDEALAPFIKAAAKAFAQVQGVTTAAESKLDAASDAVATAAVKTAEAANDKVIVSSTNAEDRAKQNLEQAKQAAAEKQAVLKIEAEAKIAAQRTEAEKQLERMRETAEATMHDAKEEAAEKALEAKAAAAHKVESAAAAVQQKAAETAQQTAPTAQQPTPEPAAQPQAAAPQTAAPQPTPQPATQPAQPEEKHGFFWRIFHK